MVPHKRRTLILRDGVIEHIFNRVFRPDHYVGDVLVWERGAKTP